MLTLHEYMWFGEGPGLNMNRRAIAFEVFGLPEKRRAWIADMNHRWGRFFSLRTASTSNGVGAIAAQTKRWQQ